MKSVNINGNIVTLGNFNGHTLLAEVDLRMLDQFSAFRESDGTFSLSFPMTPKDHLEFSGHIHRHNAKIRSLNAHLEPNGNGPKGTPPTGGTPGAARVTKFKNTVAIAA